MSFDFRSRLEAFLALATGTAAAWFVLNSPGMPGTLLTFILNNMNGLYDAFRSHNGGEIALVLFLYRIPGVLIAGLLIGLILPRIRYSRLLLLSILIWPAYVLVRSVLFVVMLESGGREAGRRGLGILFLQSNAGPEIVVCIVEFMCLFLILLATSKVLVRAGTHNMSLNSRRAKSGAPVS